MTETTETAPESGRLRRALRSRAAQRIVPPICLAAALGSAVWAGHNFGYDRGYGAGSAAADGMRTSMAEAIEQQAAADAERAQLPHALRPRDPVPLDALPPYVDRELAARASRLGLPFVYAHRDSGGWCNPQLRLPSGTTWPLPPRVSEPAQAGALLRSDVDLIELCGGSAYRTPGAPR